MKTKKQEAQERLNSIENEVKELKKIINSPDSIFDRIKTFDDVCEELGTSSTEFFNKFKGFDENTIAFEQVKMIMKVLNEGWTPNWSDSSDGKYYPYFKMSPFGFDGTTYGHWATGSYAGSRLCAKTDTIAEYAGRQFEEIYKKLLN